MKFRLIKSIYFKLQLVIVRKRILISKWFNGMGFFLYYYKESYLEKDLKQLKIN